MEEYNEEDVRYIVGMLSKGKRKRKGKSKGGKGKGDKGGKDGKTVTCYTWTAGAHFAQLPNEERQR
eukprot:5494819-Amphidinium_carterae.1